MMGRLQDPFGLHCRRSEQQPYVSLNSDWEVCNAR